MKKELPEIYKGTVTKKVNSDYYYSIYGNNNRSEKKEHMSIDNLLRSYSYIFNINVLIKTPSKDYRTRIAGKMGNNIITVNNDVIPINQILDVQIIK